MCICWRKRRASPSDVTEEEWTILEPLIPPVKPGGRPPEIERRAMVNAILSVLRSGCPWRLLPHDLPNGSTVDLSFRLWKRAGIWEQVNAALRRDLRVCASAGTGTECGPSGESLDHNQSCAWRCAWLRRWETKFRAANGNGTVDTQGLLITVKVLAADLGDREGGKELLQPLAGKLPRLQVIWAESGYAGAPFKHWVKDALQVRLAIVDHPWTGIRAVWVKEGEEVDWDQIIPKGFHILPRRWVVERTNAWITRHRRLSRDFEGTHTSGEALIYLAMTRLMLSRLARDLP
jgi:putative transposase